jgi:hypothetical protein
LAAIFWGPLASGDLDVVDAPVTIAGVDSYGYVGEGATTGDLDGDGSDDLALPALGGGAYVFYGPLVDGAWLTTDAELRVETTAPSAGGFASSAMFVGDVTGDGYDDLALGDALDSAGGDTAGAVYLLSGRSW